jgi:hypothetical protein
MSKTTTAVTTTTATAAPAAAIIGGAKVLDAILRMFGVDLPDDVDMYIATGVYSAFMGMREWIRSRRAARGK